MSETVLLAIIGGAVTLLTALIGKLSFDVGKTKKDARSAAKDAKEAREQVKNTHTTNLREEQDERHEATVSALREIARDVRGLREDHQATRMDIGHLRAEDRAGRRETQVLREEFEEHVKESEPVRAMISDLHNQYHDKKRIT
ncbi:DUF2746 domain-containing protein [Glutamicibacter sp.]|uniref:DUF2746 domain-containing protein n=1 Tax=Glutamicibacter sp. TaxID=1931995 RepID=UPI0028BDE01A|nr:DUF2746 domain-containing protein [Glutamicibacter sp.]